MIIATPVVDVHPQCPTLSTECGSPYRCIPSDPPSDPPSATRVQADTHSQVPSPNAVEDLNMSQPGSNTSSPIDEVGDLDSPSDATQENVFMQHATCNHDLEKEGSLAPWGVEVGFKDKAEAKLYIEGWAASQGFKATTRCSTVSCFLFSATT